MELSGILQSERKNRNVQPEASGRDMVGGCLIQRGKMEANRK